MWVISVATVGALWTWAMIMFAHLGYRKAVAEGRAKPSRFRMPGSPITNWIVLGFIVLVTLFLARSEHPRRPLRGTYVVRHPGGRVPAGPRRGRPAAGLMQLPPGPGAPAGRPLSMPPRGRGHDRHLRRDRRGPPLHRRRGRRHTHDRLAVPVAPDRGRDPAQAGEPPAHRLVQVARRLVKLAGLGPERRARGVVAMSAGNHAQGVAYHAQRLGIPATIVMPGFTPLTKVEGTRQYGARVDPARRGVRRRHRPRPPARAGGGARIRPPLRRCRHHRRPGHGRARAARGRTRARRAGGADRWRRPDRRLAIAARHLKPGIEIIGVEAALYPSVYRLLRKLPPEPGGPTRGRGHRRQAARAGSPCR